MPYIYIILLIIGSYFLGAIPNGLIIAKIFKQTDIRLHGSHNTGSTNVTRVLGFKYGIWVFLLDAIKGALVILILSLTHATSLYMYGDFNFISLYGMIAVVGHAFSIFLKFKGGKAIATTIGMIAVLNPWFALILLALFAFVFLISRYVSLGSLVAATVVLVTYFLRIFITIPGYTLGTKIFEFCVFAILGIIVFTKHGANISRLKSGTENKF